VINRKIAYLLALAKEGHFARAAAVCHVSQPALSAGIQQLEQELGVVIVKRGQRFQGFTEQGEIVLAWAQRMDVECKRLYQELRDRSDLLAGTLRIGVLNSTTPFTAIFTVPFQERFPEVNVRVMNHNPFDIEQGIEEGTFDVAINYLEEKSKRYKKSHYLYTQEYYAFVRKGAMFAGRESLTWDELSQVPLCLYPAETQVFGTKVYEILDASHPHIPRMETNAMLVLLDHVRTGTWASVLPKPVLFMVAGSEEFEAIPLPRVAESGGIGIALPERDRPNPLAEAFFEIATSQEVLNRFHEFMLPTPLTASR